MSLSIESNEMNNNNNNNNNNNKHPLEASDSWELYQERQLKEQEEVHGENDDDDGNNNNINNGVRHRYLKNHHHNKKSEHDQKVKELWANPGIQPSTVHGMMIDAGSSGSRLHLYEWEPRILQDEVDIQEAVSGRKLSYPGSDTRWTDRLTPGISSFVNITDPNTLTEQIQQYLQPLMVFAMSVLHEKRDQFDQFPIYLRATAGMRTLPTPDRARILTAMRSIFSNNTFCPFYFEDEYARVISGEEEAIFDWAGVNFLLGNFLQESEGAGAVINPRLTYGALDMGGASAQISYFQSEEDIMSNLFKLQIGQGKHWNVYAYSFLYYGVTEATNRFEALLAATVEENTSSAIYDPCLPGGFTKHIRTQIHIDSNGMETWEYSGTNATIEATLSNPNDVGDYEECTNRVKSLLHLDQDQWCEFAHHGDCSFAGVYQPQLPRQEKNFGEFFAMSNYARVWDFLQLPDRASLQQLETATKRACNLSYDQLQTFVNDGRVKKGEPTDYCFRSVYAFNLLRYGHGFQMNDYITASNVVNGHKIGWALGAMLYEINTFPWEYNDNNHYDEQSQSQPQSQSHHQTFQIDDHHHLHVQLSASIESIFIIFVFAAFFVSLFIMSIVRHKRNNSMKRQMYEQIMY